METGNTFFGLLNESFSLENELCDKHFYPKELLDKKTQYYALFKRWDKVAKAISEKSISLETPLVTSIKSDSEYLSLTLGQVLYAYRSFLMHHSNIRARQELCENLGISNKALLDCLKRCNEGKEITVCEDFLGYLHTQNFCEYKGEFYSLSETFFNSYQPVVDVRFSTKEDGGAVTDIQTLPAKQIAHHHGSLVLDEVGMGKTVCAMYAAAYVINQYNRDFRNNSSENFAEKPPVSILVICPYGQKQDDWEADFLRQLGLYSNKLRRNQIDSLHNRTTYYSDEPYICITGQDSNERKLSYTKSKKSQNSNESADIENDFTSEFYSPFGENSVWDLIIIDECHNADCGSYTDYRAKNLLLLTATPIRNKDGFANYIGLFSNILKPNPNKEEIVISPISIRNPDEKNWFVMRFKEDMFGGNIVRNIIWKEWSRENADMDKKYVEKLNECGILENAQYLESDYEMVNGEYSSDNKLKALLGLLKDGELKNDSVIVFVHHKAVGEYIYSALLKELSSDEIMICLKNGVGEKINQKSRNSNAIMDLKENILKGKRSILIINDDIGSTGLNFGEFDAIVNYELPFTSNELEQRFGRIERADSMMKGGGEKQEKRFVIFYNKPCDNTISESQLNRKLDYCVLHLDDTMNQIPVRNTVVLNSEFVNSKRDLIKNLKIEALLNEKIGGFSVKTLLQFSAAVRKDVDAAVFNEKERWKERISANNCGENGVKLTEENTKIPEDKIKSLLSTESNVIDEFFEKYYKSSKIKELVSRISNALHIAVITDCENTDKYKEKLLFCSEYISNVDENGKRNHEKNRDYSPERFLCEMTDNLIEELYNHLGSLDVQSTSMLFFKKNNTTYYTSLKDFREEGNKQ